MAKRFRYIAESGNVRTEVPELSELIESSRNDLDDTERNIRVDGPTDSRGKPLLPERLVNTATLSVSEKNKIHLLMILSKISAIRPEYATYGVFRIIGNEWDSEDDEQLKSVIDWLTTSGWAQSVVNFATESIGGGVRWGREAGIADSNSLLIGNLNGNPYFYNGEKSLITVAPPGAGKTQCCVLPNLASYAGSVVVLDIKGECLRETKSKREQFGNVKVFNPQEPHNSASYNPLYLIPDDIDLVWEESRYLAELLVPKPTVGEQTWVNHGRHLLTLILSHITLHLDTSAKHMELVLDYISGILLEETLAELSEANDVPAPLKRAATKFHNMLERSPKQFEGILSGASEALAIWEGIGIGKITKSSDWMPSDLRQSRPLSLFLQVTPNAIETYSPLLRVIIGQHVRELLRVEPEREKLLPILFMLDELPRLGNMEPIREALEVGRSYGLKLWMFVQYVGQLEKAYGYEIAHGMISNCGLRSYMNIDTELANKLSREIGEREGLFDGKKHPLVTPQELSGPSWSDSILAIATGEYPVRLEKSFFHAKQ